MGKEMQHLKGTVAVLYTLSCGHRVLCLLDCHTASFEAGAQIILML